MPSVSVYVCQHVWACAHTDTGLHLSTYITIFLLKGKNNFIPCPDKMLRQGLHKFFRYLEATSKF